MKHKNKKVIIVFALLILGLAGYLLFPKASTNKKTQLRIGIIKTQSGLPTYVALENQLFEEKGFEVEVLSFKTSDQTFNALKNGDIDVVGVSGLAQALKLNDIEPNLFKIIGVLNSSPSLVVKIESDIDEIKDLENSTIGVFPGSIFGKYVLETLRAANVNIDNVTLSPLPPPLQLNELENGKVDALFTLEPIGAMAAFQNKARYLTKENLFSKYLLNGKPFPGGVVVVSESFISANNKDIEDITKVYEDVMITIRSNGFNATPYLDKYTSIDSETLNSIEYDGASFGTEISVSGLVEFQNSLNSWGILKNPIDFEDLIYE